MEKITVAGQWNGEEEMMLNIPYFPHLHASFTTDFSAYNRYPHPLEYFLCSLIGTITNTIKSFIEQKELLLKNLYITTEGDIEKTTARFKTLVIHIRLDSNATPAELTTLQKKLLKEEPILNLLKHKEYVNISWD